MNKLANDVNCHPMNGDVMRFTTIIVAAKGHALFCYVISIIDKIDLSES